MRGLFLAWGIALFTGAVSIGCSPQAADQIAIATDASQEQDSADQIFGMIGGQLVGDKRPGAAALVVGLQLLEVDGRYLSHCGGVLYRPDVILTAAHCFDRRRLPTLGWVRALYATNIDSYRKADPQARSAVNVVPHPLYDTMGEMHNGKRLPSYDHDIAVVILESPFPAVGATVRLASNDEGIKPGDRVSSYGYGRSFERSAASIDGNPGPNFWKLQRGYFTVSSEWRMDRVYMREQASLSLCQGDSGGPVFLRQAAGTSSATRNVYTLVAINSGSKGNLVPGGNGRQYCRGPALMQPVAEHREWIERVLRENGR